MSLASAMALERLQNGITRLIGRIHGAAPPWPADGHPKERNRFFKPHPHRQQMIRMTKKRLEEIDFTSKG